MPESKIRTRFIFGDIHGELDTLLDLLEKIDLASNIPASIELIFLGDLIDRGPNSAKVVDFVKSLCDVGKARCILGNHEFNFIQFNTETEKKSGIYRRPRNNDNLTQIAETWTSYKEFQDPSAKMNEHLEWMKTLPIAIEVDGLRMVHACWSPENLNKCIKKDDSWYLSNYDWDAAWVKNTEAYNRVEILCKGLESPLPNGITFKDGSGKERKHVRVAWWNNKPTNWKEYMIARGIQWDTLPKNFEFTEHGLTPKKPTLFGHYWFNGDPKIINENTACLDYSVASKSGKLCAYEWRAGDKKLCNSRLHYSIKV
jgi:hypothetical protein